MFFQYFIWVLGAISLLLVLLYYLKSGRKHSDFHVLIPEFQESFFHFITESIPISFYCKDVEKDFRYTHCNRLCKDCLGHELISFTDFDIQPKEIAEKTRACDESLLEKPLGTVAFFEEKYIDRSGEERYVRTYKQIVRTDAGTRVLLGIGIDITKEVFLRKRLEERKTLFQAIIDNIPLGIAVRDVEDQMRYLLWNKENERLTAIPEGIVLNNNQNSLEGILFDIPTSSMIKEDDEDTFRASAKEISVKRKFTTLSGDQLDLDIYKKFLKLSDGRQLFIDFIRDITREKEMKKWEEEKSEYQKEMICKSYLFNDGLRYMLEGKDPDRVINHILKNYAIAESADKASIFIFKDEKHRLADCYYEWVASGIPSQLSKHQYFDMNEFPEIMQKLELLEEIIWERTDDFSHDPNIRQFLESRNLRSFVVLPMKLEGRLTGFIVLEYIRTACFFSDADIRSLYNATRLVELAYFNKVKIASILNNRHNAINFFDSTPVPLLIFSPYGKLIRLNKPAEAFLSVFDCVKLNAICSGKVCSRQSGSPNGCPVFRAIHEKKKQIIRIEKENGNAYLISVYPLLDEKENLHSVVVFLEDISVLQENVDDV